MMVTGPGVQFLEPHSIASIQSMQLLCLLIFLYFSDFSGIWVKTQSLFTFVCSNVKGPQQVNNHLFFLLSWPSF